MYHKMKRGMLVSALRMLTAAKLAMRMLGTVLKVLNLISKRQIVPFPTIDPIMTTAIMKIFEILCESRHECN